MAAAGEQEVAFPFWNDVNLKLRTVRVTSNPILDFHRSAGQNQKFRSRGIGQTACTTSTPPQRAVHVSITTGNGEDNMLKCKAVSERAGLNSEKFDLKTSRSRYATRMLRSDFNVRTVQHWMAQIVGDDHAVSGTNERCARPARSGCRAELC